MRHRPRSKADRKKTKSVLRLPDGCIQEGLAIKPMSVTAIPASFA
jgi:hypothetical protein